MPMTDHSGDQQAAPLRTPREQVEGVSSDSVRYQAEQKPLFAFLLLRDLCAALDPVLATVERLEAAERNRTHMRGVQGHLPPLNDWDDCSRCGRVECVCGQPKPVEPPASPPVPPSPPQFFDCDCGAINGLTSGVADTVRHDIACASFEQKLVFDRLPPVPPAPPAAERAQPVHAIAGRNGVTWHHVVTDEHGVEVLAMSAQRWNSDPAIADVSPYRVVRLTELRDGEETIATADLTQLRRDLAESEAMLNEATADSSKHAAEAVEEGDRADAALDQLARLRARLADGVRGEVQSDADGMLYAALDQDFAIGTPVLVLPDEPEGEG